MGIHHACVAVSAAVLLSIGCGGRGKGGAYGTVYDGAVMNSAYNDYERDCGAHDRAKVGPVPIEPADGVDRCEAQAIANERIGVLGCGSVGPPQDHGAEWLVPVRFGIEGRALEPLRIDKRTGRVTGDPVIPDSKPKSVGPAAAQ